jgi:hypothetical protein
MGIFQKMGRAGGLILLPCCLGLAQPSACLNIRSKKIAPLLTKLSSSVLAGAGYRVVEDLEPGCQLQVTINASAKALSARYKIGGVETEMYSGAAVDGEIIVQEKGAAPVKTRFAGRYLPPDMVNIAQRRDGPAQPTWTEEKAPFLDAMVFADNTSRRRPFLVAWLTVVRELVGPERWADALIAATAARTLPALEVSNAAAKVVKESGDTVLLKRAYATWSRTKYPDRDRIWHLIERLDPLPFVRRETIRQTATQTDAASLEALIAALKDPNPEVRLEATRGLATRSEERATAALIESSRDDDDAVRSEAARALKMRGASVQKP